MDKNPICLSPQCQNYVKLGPKVTNVNPPEKGIRDKQKVSNERRKEPNVKSSSSEIRKGREEGRVPPDTLSCVP